MIRDAIPLNEKKSYYLNPSRPVGPFSQGELRSLLANNVIVPTTLVWHPGKRIWQTLVEEALVVTNKSRLRRTAVGLGAAILCAGLAVGLLTTGLESGMILISNLEASQKILSAIRAPQNIQNSTFSTSDLSELGQIFTAPDLSSFGPRRNRPSRTTDRQTEKASDEIATIAGMHQEQWSKSSFSRAAFTFNSVRPSLASQAARLVPGAESPAKGRLVQEFWRSMVPSDITDRYAFYLSNYPSGAFADLATSRIKELRKATKKVAVAKIARPVKKKKNNNPSSTIQALSSDQISTANSPPRKTPNRCRDGDTLRCKSPATEEKCARSTTNTKPCVIRNYQSSKREVLLRSAPK